jgi:membrane protease YdiL (CAAX protease family)
MAADFAAPCCAQGIGRLLSGRYSLLFTPWPIAVIHPPNLRDQGQQAVSPGRIGRVVIAPMTVARFAGLALALAALVRETLSLRAPGAFPIARLIRRELRPSHGSAWMTALCFIAGVLLVAVPVLWDVTLGGATMSRALRWQHASVLAVIGTILIKVAWVFFEELSFRAALITAVARRVALPLAVLVSALAFAAAHGRDVASTTILVIDGVGYGAAYVATRSLRAPIAWHAGKNITVWALTGQSTMQLIESPWRLTTTDSSSVAEIAMAAVIVGLTAMFLWRCSDERLAAASTIR